MKILLVAYYFPPDSSSGSFRPLFFANHLTGMGDKITILTSRPEDFLDEQPVDPDLTASLDPRVEVMRSTVLRPREYFLRLRDRLAGRSVRSSRTEGSSDEHGGGTSWIRFTKDFFTDLLTTPDPHVGWIPSCVRQGLAIIRDQQPDIILATGGPWSGLLCGSLLKQLTGVPLALDFRDPWLANPDHVRRDGIFRKIDAYLEQRVVGNADLLVANTEALRHDFLRRYADLSPDRIVTLTNGFEDYLPDSARERNCAVTLTHAGALYSSRNPRPLLEAVRNTVESGRIGPGELKLRFVGGIAVDDPIIAQILASPSLARSIEVIPRVTYQESLRAMAESDVLILYQPGFPLQVPRKLYDYMAARRPILCVSDAGSATRSLVEHWSLGTACENDTIQLEKALITMYEKWQHGQLGPLTDDRCDSFQNHNLALQLRTHMAQCLRTPNGEGAVLADT